MGTYEKMTKSLWENCKDTFVAIVPWVLGAGMIYILCTMGGCFDGPIEPLLPTTDDWVPPYRPPVTLEGLDVTGSGLGCWGPGGQLQGVQSDGTYGGACGPLSHRRLHTTGWNELVSTLREGDE